MKEICSITEHIDELYDFYCNGRGECRLDGCTVVKFNDTEIMGIVDHVCDKYKYVRFIEYWAIGEESIKYYDNCLYYINDDKLKFYNDEEYLTSLRLNEIYNSEEL